MSIAFPMIFLYQEIRTIFTLVCNQVICHDRQIKFIRGAYSENKWLLSLFWVNKSHVDKRTASENLKDFFEWSDLVYLHTWKAAYSWNQKSTEKSL